MSAFFFFVPTPPHLPFHSFMLRGCHSSIKATNGTRKTFSERIVVHPQVCSLLFLKVLELGIFLGLPIESAGYTFLCLLPLSWDYKHICFLNPFREMFPCNFLHVTVSFVIVLRSSWKPVLLCYLLLALRRHVSPFVFMYSGLH